MPAARHRRPLVCLAGLLLLVPAVVSTANGTAADAPPPADEVTINRASTSGSGCPRRAVTCDISPDRTVVTLGFDEFQTYIGHGRAAGDRDKNCDIHLGLRYPSGYTFAVVDVTYHGFAMLDSGVTGSLSSTYSFEGGAGGGSTTTHADITGGGGFARGQVYTAHDQIPTSRMVRSSCGGGANANMLIRTRINLSSTNDSATGQMTDDDASVALTQQVHFAWQKCK